MSEEQFKSKEIESWHSKLNSKSHAPKYGFRRNSVIYTLVCYVNNIIGCYSSKNEEPIPIFIGRARQFMQEHPPSEEWYEYYEMVKEYLNSMEKTLELSGFDARSIYTE